MCAREWKTLAAAQEALEAEDCSFGEPGVGVNRKGSLGSQSSIPQMEREIVEVIGEEIVDVTALSSDATEALQLKIQREFYDMFTTKEACLAGSRQLTTHLEAARITW